MSIKDKVDEVDRDIEIIGKAEAFYNKFQEENGANHRYRSWEHCYKCFYDAREKRKNNENVDYDYLSLQLAFYLASWGMYRGSSFLLQKDYKVHKSIVEMILRSDYDCLCDIEWSELGEEDVKGRISILNSLVDNMNAYYSGIRDDVIREKINEPNIDDVEHNNDIDNNKISHKEKNKVSDTLITKILMGTLGCVPAYDRYFIEGIKKTRVSTGIYNENSLLKLITFYNDYKGDFEEKRKKFKVYDLKYPQMKLLDMCFWQIGYEMDQKKRNEESKS